MIIIVEKIIRNVWYNNAVTLEVTKKKFRVLPQIGVCGYYSRAAADNNGGGVLATGVDLSVACLCNTSSFLPAPP